MTEKTEATPRRILLALDAASLSNAVLETAVELAARLQAELHGLFIEDIDLLRSAELPFVQEFSLTRTSGAVFDAPRVEGELKLLAAQARRTLQDAARRSKIHCTFDVVRGQLAASLAHAAADIDLVVLRGSCRPVARYLKMEAPGRTATLDLGRSVLLLEAEAGLPGVIFAAFDGEESGAKALRMGAELAASAQGELRVLLLVDHGRARGSLEAEARTLLRDSAVSVSFQVIQADDLTALRGATRGRNAGLLVLGATSPNLAGAERARLIESLGCPLLLVR